MFLFLRFDTMIDWDSFYIETIIIVHGLCIPHSQVAVLCLLFPGTLVVCLWPGV